MRSLFYVYAVGCVCVVYVRVLCWCIVPGGRGVVDVLLRSQHKTCYMVVVVMSLWLCVSLLVLVGPYGILGDLCLGGSVWFIMCCFLYWSSNTYLPTFYVDPMGFPPRIPWALFPGVQKVQLFKPWRYQSASVKKTSAPVFFILQGAALFLLTGTA